MTDNRVGALVVVKPDDERLVAGIITERGKQFKFLHLWNRNILPTDLLL